MCYAYYSSPIGLIKIKGSKNGIEILEFVDDGKQEEMCKQEEIDENTSLALKELDEYFNNKRTTFTVKINIQGTEFQKKVWKELINIPYGKTYSYKQIAEAIGNPKAARAVGNANNKNKIAIIIPCHRVIGKDGKLVGYAGGINRKKYLLELENISL
jgi:methylated-DNA-[protein]-cysteine S-methyltransferase